MKYSKALRMLLSDALSKDLFFAAYSNPGSDEVNFMCQLHGEIKSIKSSDMPLGNGFFMAPFEPAEFSLWIKADVFVQHATDYFIDLPKVNYSKRFIAKYTKPIDQTTYASKVKQLTEDLKKGVLSKVVFSRTKDFKPNQSLEEVFLDLNASHRDAFVFLVNLPGGVSWIGASPELLISNEAGKCKTMALAATKTVSEINRPWSEKERTEQNYVSDYIESILGNHSLEFSKSGPEEKKLNSGILHLCTDFLFNYPKEYHFWSLVSDLHPTPAVCGIPKESAMREISNIEAHNRDYYTGFLGPVLEEKGIYLYVNLRSARVVKGKGTLFVGGGITAESDPDSEWQETELKAKTILNSALGVSKMKEYSE